MCTFVAISALLALLVLVPKTIQAAGRRALCSECKYDLAGLEEHGICPECGATYHKDMLVRVGWKMRWRLIPRILLTMLVPALGPTSFLAVYALLLNRTYHWGWVNSWDQAADRDLAGAGIFSLPLVVNSWAMLMWPRYDTHGSFRSFDDLTGRSDFWLRFGLTSLVGLASLALMGYFKWLWRRYNLFELGGVVGTALLLGGIIAANIAVEIVNRRKQRHRHHERSSDDRDV